ncbi:MAG TPA: hypothetical protein H9866_05805 [Candidatus Tidjanibacter gallistercoris]|nr:hypothetical protein [Candidatus Tidjanibacter gallistercoris]
MPGPKDYTRSGFYITLLVIVLLLCVSFVPGFRVGNVVVKRANILSDIVTFHDEKLVPVSDMELLDTSFLEDFRPVPVQDIVDATGVTGPEGIPGAEQGAAGEPEGLSVPLVADSGIVRITDYSADGQMMARFYHALAYEAGERPVRIAVLGDSFIEADIITADMRELLQMKYGGNGVGFVPFSTPLSKYRGTVTHNHDGWTNYNLIKRKSVPEAYKDWFFVSGMLSIPAENASTEYRGVQFRRRIEKTNTASLFFVNRGHTVLEVTVNDTEKRNYVPDFGERVQRICIGEPDISRLRIDLAHTDGFIGYGAVLEDSVGVSVHNFSVRSNSGLALLGTDYSINRQFDEYMNYDMVILQYGLNAMSADVTDYSYYQKQLVRIIDYIKQCFPGSSVVVMSVGDRSTMQNGTAVTMPAVKAMLRAQERAARECGVGFWNTYEAMGGDNSMPRFVERHWAAKDYTHIGYSGGKYIAEQFVKFLDAAVESIREQDAERARREEERRLEEERRRAEVLLGRGTLMNDSLSDRLKELSGGAFSFGAVAGARQDTTYVPGGGSPLRERAEAVGVDDSGIWAVDTSRMVRAVREDAGVDVQGIGAECREAAGGTDVFLQPDAEPGAETGTAPASPPGGVAFQVEENAGVDVQGIGAECREAAGGTDAFRLSDAELGAETGTAPASSPGGVASRVEDDAVPDDAGVPERAAQTVGTAADVVKP